MPLSPLQNSQNQLHNATNHFQSVTNIEHNWPPEEINFKPYQLDHLVSGSGVWSMIVKFCILWHQIFHKITFNNYNRLT